MDEEWPRFLNIISIRLPTELDPAFELLDPIQVKKKVEFKIYKVRLLMSPWNFEFRIFSLLCFRMQKSSSSGTDAMCIIMKSLNAQTDIHQFQNL